MSDSQNISFDKKLNKKPWGFFYTIGISAVILFVFYFFQILVLFCFAFIGKINNPQINILEYATILETDGFCLSVSTIISLPAVVGFIYLFSLIRGFSLKEYVDFKKLPGKQIFQWIIISLLFVICSDLLSLFLKKEIVPKFSIDVYKTAVFAPMLWFAFLICAPLQEEILMRGFMYKGISNSRAGFILAILLTSLIWAGLHRQYDLYGTTMIFFVGLFLGFARYKSGSILAPILIHSVVNFIATLEAFFVISK